ncbi:hypothetical protein GQ600_25133 [Phytophthora cactorum]|nr:hypothetical protein GQ600_25133 [Phytophthora cactorum]
MWPSGTVHLLKAVEASEERDEDSEDTGPPIRPLDHLARFMLRRNPRHNESVVSRDILLTLVTTFR